MSELDGTDQKLDYYPRLKRLHQYVEQSYSEPIPLEKAAGIVALESSYFSSYFRAKVGITFTEWLRQVRVEKAMELMKAGDFSITRGNDRRSSRSNGFSEAPEIFCAEIVSGVRSLFMRSDSLR